MLQYVLTGLAGVILGVVVVRIWQARDAEPVASSAPREVQSGTEPAASSSQDDSVSRARRYLLPGAGILVMIAAALMALGWGGKNSATDSTAPGAPVAPGQEKLDDVDTMIQRLEDRLKSNPNDGEGFRMLGWSYVMTGHPDKALQPYRRALQLLPENAAVHAGYGEALVAVAGGKVTAEAKSEFDRALKLDPKEPRARYFAGLWLAQNGNKREALDQWIELANAGSPDAPWQAEVQAKIKETAKELGVDISGKLKSAGVAASPIAATPAGQGGAAPPSVDAMVEGLAAKLAANPRNPDGWVMLLRSRMVQSQQDKAASDLVSARKALADDPQGLAKVNEAAQALGIPGS